MSHSDSEINDLQDKIRKQLSIQFKAKKRFQAPDQIRALKKKLEPIFLEYRLVQAVNTHNSNEVKRLLDQGVSPNSTDSEMRSALHVAVSKGFVIVA